MTTNAFMIGKSVYLRPFERSDLAHICRWYNAPELRGPIGVTEPYNAVKADQWFEEMCRDEHRVWFAIVLKENDRVIGECGLLRMFAAWKTTDLTIIIGDSDAQGRGYGSEAIGLLLDYAFGYLGFHRVAVGVAGFNEDAVRFYEKSGFKREGIQRDGYFYNHRYHDFVMMSILEDEFRACSGRGS